MDWWYLGCVWEIALVVSLLLSKQFEATSTVAFTQPDIVYQFDPRIQMQVGIPPTEGVADLAMSLDVMSEAVKAAERDQTAQDGQNLQADDLRQNAEATCWYSFAAYDHAQ